MLHFLSLGKLSRDWLSATKIFPTITKSSSARLQPTMANSLIRSQREREHFPSLRTTALMHRTVVYVEGDVHWRDLLRSAWCKCFFLFLYEVRRRPTVTEIEFVFMHTANTAVCVNGPCAFQLGLGCIIFQQSIYETDTKPHLLGIRHIENCKGSTSHLMWRFHGWFLSSF